MDGTVLIIGSGPNAVTCRDWPAGEFGARVAINNAWRVRDDWTHLIHPEDFPPDRRPSVVQSGQQIVTAADYVPLQNRNGGFVYAGGTMAFTAGYWALEALRPRVMAFIGCDMVYPSSGSTHFYGTGEADPLRADPTLRSLEAKAARLALLAARKGCHCVNLSVEDSRLVFPRAGVEDLHALCEQPVDVPGPSLMAGLESAERDLGYYVPSGRYWKEQERFDTMAIDRLDSAWSAVHATWTAAQTE